jgi:DNA-binding transcriptional ArsR family regulator
VGSASSKTRLYDGFAAVGKALSSGRRLELLDVLAQGPRSVERLAAEIGQGVANTSSHLQVLLGAGLVTTERDGNRVVYALAGAAVEDLCLAHDPGARRGVDRLAVDYLGDRAARDDHRADLAERLRHDPRRWCSMSVRGRVPGRPCPCGVGAPMSWAPGARSHG